MLFTPAVSGFNVMDVLMVSSNHGYFWLLKSFHSAITSLSSIIECDHTLSSRCLWRLGMMYLSSGLLCLTLLSLKRSAATCTLHKLSSLLQARIINLYSRQHSVSIFHLSLFVLLRASISVSSSSPSSLMQSTLATRQRSLPSLRWEQHKVWMPVVFMRAH